MNPTAGMHFADRLNPGCTWRVEAIGTHTSTVYIRMFRDGEPTASTMEWPLDRWPHFADTQLEAQGQETT